MSKIQNKIVSLASTSYPTDPQLDTNGCRGIATVMHMTPGGTPVWISLDGVNDHVKIDPLVTPGCSFEHPYYTKMWARLSTAGAADVQLVIEGI